MGELKSYAVWDAGTRWFHWINALCILALASVGLVIFFAGDLGITNEGKITLKTLHVWVGYVLALNLLWRIAWGFLGNRYARWRSILPGGRGYLQALDSYLAALRAGRPESWLGHNPLGRLAVAVLLLLVANQVITGLLLAGTDLFYPPLGYWIAQWVAAPGVAPDTLVPNAPELYDKAAWDSMRAFRKPYAMVHLYGFYALAVMVVIHLVAVILTDVREKGNLISAMFTGQKILGGSPVDGDSGNHV